jgi:hypothetical protein
MKELENLMASDGFEISFSLPRAPQMMPFHHFAWISPRYLFMPQSKCIKLRVASQNYVFIYVSSIAQNINEEKLKVRESKKEICEVSACQLSIGIDSIKLIVND